MVEFHFNLAVRVLLFFERDPSVKRNLKMKENKETFCSVQIELNIEIIVLPSLSTSNDLNTSCETVEPAKIRFSNFSRILSRLPRSQYRLVPEFSMTPCES